MLYFLYQIVQEIVLFHEISQNVHFDLTYQGSKKWICQSFSTIDRYLLWQQARYFSGHPKYFFLETWKYLDSFRNYNRSQYRFFICVQYYFQRIPKRLFWISTKRSRPWQQGNSTKHFQISLQNFPLKSSSDGSMLKNFMNCKINLI